jgi:hypothetical protein
VVRREKGESVVPAFCYPTQKINCTWVPFDPIGFPHSLSALFCFPSIAIFLALFQFDHFCSCPFYSRGYTCADPNFPGVSSRISESYDFIRQQVCAFAPDTASDDFRCAELIASYTPSPTPGPVPTAPTMSPAPTFLTQPCVIMILLDNWATEIGWHLVDLVTKATVVEASPGTYTIEDEVVVQVDLIPGRTYSFTITDSYGDGLVGDYTGYAVILGTNLEQGKRLVNGSSSFGKGRTTEFTVPVTATHRPTKEPTTGPTLVTTAAPTTTTTTRLPTVVAELNSIGHNSATPSGSIPSPVGPGCQMLVVLLLATTSVAAAWIDTFL